MSNTRAFVYLTVLIVCLGGIPGIAGASDAIGETDTGEDFDPDDIVIDVAVDAHGDANWTLEHRYLLSNESDRAAFEDLSADIAANSSPYRDRFAERMEDAIANAEQATGRSMQMANVSVETEQRSIPQEYGIVRYTFEWEGFAAVEGERLHVGDAIAGLFLDDDSNLRVRWTAEYTAESIDPAASERGDSMAVWRGPMEFDADEPHLILRDESEGGLLQLLSTGPVVFVAGLALLVGSIGVGWFWFQENREVDRKPTDETLLSNEERVVALLESEDGRMKQQEIVEALGWTEAKTSQVLSELREEGTIESFRLGRENVIRLPEDEDAS